MNAFEEIVKQYLETEGYWVRQSVKVEISKDDKKEIGLPTMPRPEIDLVALNVKENELLLVEVKSFLDSQGVYWEVVCDEKNEYPAAKRYRLFTDKKFRTVVTKRLHQEYLTHGLINEKTKINYALAAGKFHSERDEGKIREHFSRRGRGWKLFTPTDIKNRIREFAERGWEDNLITITAKLTKEAIS
jgi:hypothetical protein